jgi:hypothetical protein
MPVKKNYEAVVDATTPQQYLPLVGAPFEIILLMHHYRTRQQIIHNYQSYVFAIALITVQAEELRQ